MKNNKIDSFFVRLKKGIAYRKMIKSSSVCLAILMISIFFMVNIELFLYLDILDKERFFYFIVSTTVTFTIFIVTQFLINFYGFHNNNDDKKISKMVWERFPNIRDRLLNIILLEKSKNYANSRDLIEYAADDIKSQIDPILISDLYKSNNLLKYTYLSLFIVIICIIYNPYHEASIRLINFSTVYNPEKPFKIESTSKNVSVVSGDSIILSFLSTGKLIPSMIDIHILDHNNEEEIINVFGNGRNFKKKIKNIFINGVYWAEYENKKIFSPWDKIVSDSSIISIKNRPIIKGLSFSISPPLYTGIKPYTHETSISDISVPEGSIIETIITDLKDARSCWIEMGTSNINFTNNANDYYAQFQVYQNENLTIGCVDNNGLENIPKPNFRLNNITDYPPQINIISPKSEVEIDDSNEILIEYQARDDYLISKLEIEYYVLSPDYMIADTTIYTGVINIDRSSSIISNQYSFSLNNIFLAPSDEIHIRLVATDNNIISGPSKTTSKEIVARTPSIEDLYERMDDSNQEVMDDLSVIDNNIDDISDMIEEIKLDLLKEKDLTWEQQEEIKGGIEEIESIANQMEQIQEAMTNLQEQADKNNLLSDKMIEKYDKFQDLLDQIMTPELLDAMEKLQNAMDEKDQSKLLEAIQNFEYDLDMFEDQMDRLIDMFEIAIAEQKLDELSKSLESIINQQNEISKELDKNDINFDDLASDQRYQEQRFNNFEDALSDSIESISNISEDTADELKDLSENNIVDDIKSNLNSTRKNMQNNNKSPSIESSKNASDSLDSLSSMLNDIKNNFNDSMIEDIKNDLLSIIHGILYISANQEKLLKKSEGVRSRNPIIPNLALNQNVIMIENSFLNNSIIELGKKTFHITPEIARAMGKAQNSISKSISLLEQKQISKSRKEQKAIIENLNQTATMLIQSLKNMQDSGSASGFQSFMDQLEKMSTQQDGINQGTMQLGQLGMASQMNMMEELLKQQQALKEQLEDIISDNPGQGSGGLSKATNDMEEVIDDFIRNDIDRETINRQEKILSRLIDSQKSLTQRDYSNKRKNESSEKFDYSGPTGLPNNLGDRDKALSNAMRMALDENLPIEYNRLITNYFKGLYNND